MHLDTLCCFGEVVLDGTTKWSKQIKLKNFSPISLSADGTLYFFTNSKLYAYNSLNGDIKWEYSIPYDPNHKSAPTIDSSGTIYIVDNVGTIYAINPDGTLKWQYLTEQLSRSSTRTTIDPFIGLDGTIYASNGIQLWSIETETAVIGSTLAIAEDGTIYVAGNMGKIYAIGGDVEEGEEGEEGEEPTNPPLDPEPPVEPKGDRAILVITLNTGIEKEYDLSMQEVQQFINWYEGKAAGTGPITFAINKYDNNKGPFKQRQDYIIFDKLVTFEVNEY